MKSFRTFRFNWALSLVLLAGKAWGAACCGGGFALPSVITGDDKALVTASWVASKIAADVGADGVWQHNQVNDQSKVLRIDAATIFNDRYQAGLSVPVQERSRDGQRGGRSSGLGDVTLQSGYEYLPDWDYSPWRPKGVGFVTLALPTGKSIYEDSTSGLDTVGRGFWSLGLGTVLVKSYTVWDFNSTLEAHRSFNKDVHTTDFNGTVKPGYGASWGVGAGYNIGNLRLGSALTWFYEDPIKATGSIESQGSVQRFATGTLSASYVLPDSWATTVSYSDQTLFGEPVQASLSRTVAFFLQKRFAR